MDKILSQRELDYLINNKKDGILKCFMELPFGEIITFNIKRTNNGDYFVHYENPDFSEVIFHELLTVSLPIGYALQHKTLYNYNI